MQGKTYKKFVNNQVNYGGVVDPYFNDVILLMSGSVTDNPQGLPFSTDYSKFKRHTRSFRGSSTASGISYPLTNSGTTDPIPALAGADSCIYFPNDRNRVLRAAEINETPTIASLLDGTYIDVKLSGDNTGFSLGTDPFTIELSFFTTDIYPCQAIFVVGAPITLNSFTVPSTFDPSSSGYGILLKNQDLFFFANSQSFKINVNPILIDTFYTVAVQRTGNTIQTYLNYDRTASYSTSANLDFSTAGNTETTNVRAYLGMAYVNRWGGSYIKEANIDTTFSGGVAQLRITKNVTRYPNVFYGNSMPFYKTAIQNPIDPLYSDVLTNFPCEFDFYNYASPPAVQLSDPNLRNNVPDYSTGYLNIDGTNIRVTPNLAKQLDPANWTMETYVAFYDNNLPMDSKTIPQWLQNIIVAPTVPDTVSLFRVKSNGKIVMSLDFTYHRVAPGSGYTGFCYFSFSASEDGTNLITFPSEIGNMFAFYAVYTNVPLPDTQIKFFGGSYGAFATGFTTLTSDNTTQIKSAYLEPSGVHLAVSRSGGNLYFYVNGINVKIVPFTYTLYQELNKLDFEIGGQYDPWTTDTGASTRTIAVKGIKLVNDEKYNSLITNNYFAGHCLQPLALQTSQKTHPRARVLSIVKVVTLPSISTSTAEWYVFLAQPVDNLLLGDFALVQLEGVTGATKVSLIKDTEYQYRVTANTGTANGQLGLSFIDNNTVKYKGTLVPISNYANELDFLGEFYIINKSAPVPTLTSGSSPYINGAFEVTITWNAAIVVFEPTRIGVSNGILSNLSLIDDINQIYTFTVTPIVQGVVYVQASEGAGITDGAISSAKSNLLSRIYAESFPILQLPLDLANTFYDVSPNAYQLTEVITNNTIFSSTVFPVGTNSSLSVVPALEQGGLEYSTFNSVSSVSTNTFSSDWTIEFLYRGNSTGGKITNICSLEDGTSGFAVVASNGFIQIIRSVDIPSNLFGAVTMHETDIFSGSTPIYPDWTDTNYTDQQKFPHFAITRKGTTYRFYRNGKRIGLVQSSLTLNITKGFLKVGYYRNRVTYSSYQLSNLRLMVGAALYTAFQHDVPLIPYQQITNILDVSELLDYISIFSNNDVTNKAINGNKVYIRYKSIIPLENLPAVTILGNMAESNVLEEYNTYLAYITVNEIVDKEVDFSINITNEPNLPNKTFTTTTNLTSVFIENSLLTAVITTDEPNNNAYLLYMSLTFNKNVVDFDITKLTLVNCVVSNAIKASNENKYTFQVKATLSGTFSVFLDGAIVNSDIGTSNNQSNTLSRIASVPVYIPDAYYSNVLLLLQPQAGAIVDESQFELILSTTNVTLSTDVHPAGILKSIYFNGQGSSIVATMNQPLTSNVDYCIEFYIYVSNFTTFTLSPPLAEPADSITPTSFDMNWTSSVGATNYAIDVAPISSFSTKVPGYDNLQVGNTTTYRVENDGIGEAPIMKGVKILGDKGFVAQWVKVAQAVAYRVFISLSQAFTTNLKEFDKVVTVPSQPLGTVTDATYVVASTIENPPATVVTSSASTSILQGIMSSGAISPKIYAFNDEKTIRVYGSDEYVDPLIAEDMEPAEWVHIALVNTGKYLKLYKDGLLVDKIKNTSVNWDAEINVGYAINNFKGYLTGLRITAGIPRYLDNFDRPTLPLAKN